MKHQAEWALLAIFGLAAGGCGGGGGGGSDDAPLPPPRVLVGLAVSPSQSFLVPDGTVTLSVVGYFSYGPDAPVAVTWSSDNEPAAMVVSSGQVTAVAAGQAVITATSVDDPTIQQTADIEVIDWSAATVYSFDWNIGLQSYPAAGGPPTLVPLAPSMTGSDCRGMRVVGNVMYAVFGGSLYHIDLSTGVVTPEHTFASAAISLAVDDAGRLYVAINNNATAPSSDIWRYDPASGASEFFAIVPVHAASLVADRSGNIYAADNSDILSTAPHWIVRAPADGGFTEFPFPAKEAWNGGLDLTPNGRTMFALDVLWPTVIRYDDLDGDGYFEAESEFLNGGGAYWLGGVCWIGSGLLINDIYGSINFVAADGLSGGVWSAAGLDSGNSNQVFVVKF